MATSIILTKADHDLIMGFINKNGNKLPLFTLKKLEKELETASIVDPQLLPDNVVRVGSKVSILMKEEKKEMELMLVLPPHADIKENRISIFAPLGTALIGYKEGDLIDWELPAGRKTIHLKKVTNKLSGN